MEPQYLSIPAGHVDAYRTDTLLLTARRVPTAAVLVLSVVAAGSGLDWRYHPERAPALLLGFAAYFVVAAVHIMVVRRRPALSVVMTQGVLIYVAVSLSVYCGVVHARTEVLLLCLALLMTGSAVLFPWGVRGQLCASVGVAIGYPLALALGTTPTLPVPYEVFGLMVAAGVTVLGTYVLSEHQFSAFQQEAFSAALLGVGRTLSATISDPEALATGLTDEMRRALGADWAVFYQRDATGAVFRATGLSKVPETVAAEIRVLDFSPATTPNFHRLLRESGTVEIFVEAGGEGLDFALLLRRWGVSVALLQAIKHEKEVTGVLGCCYTARQEPFQARERQLLAAIATQASLALENARLMEEARRANQFKSDFVATLSHELRTPLSVILGYTDLLLEGVDNRFEERNMLQRIRQQSTQLNDLIQAMLDLNRLETRRLALTLSAFTVEELIAGIRDNLPANWCQEGVVVQWKIWDGRVVVHSDRGKVEMILRNLVHNALKYTDAGSVIITAEPSLHDRRVVFTVSDTGPGIAHEERSAIFEMFRQSSRTPSRGGGVGLGLYIVQRFTEALGGQIALESRVGSGARFAVSLPMEAPPAIMA